MYANVRPRFESQLEADTHATLSEANIRFLKGASIFHLVLQNGKQITFRPDFVLTTHPNSNENIDIKIGNRAVHVEPHSGAYFDDMFIEKLQAFMRSGAHETNFLLLIMEREFKPYVDRKLQIKGMKITDVCDQVWFIDRNFRSKHDGQYSRMDTTSTSIIPRPNKDIAQKLREFRRSFDCGR